MLQTLEVNLTIVGADTYNLNKLKTKPKGNKYIPIIDIRVNRSVGYVLLVLLVSK